MAEPPCSHCADDAPEQGGAQQGVLLYYKYVPLSTMERLEVVEWLKRICSELLQVGRVRVAFDGVNVTVGGQLQGLHKHVEAVQAHRLLCGTDIDFKLTASAGAVNERAARETGFQELKVMLCEELVTLGPQAAGVGVEQGGVHASPMEFHSLLSSATEGSVIIDTRNVYETRIGHFSAPGVELLDPCTRQFSDFPAWVDANQDRLQGRRMFLYCTGGVRCERASAYVRSKGAGFEDVFQLSGGIQRYLEAFPDGGFFKGKNFVFDERLAVGAPVSNIVIGSCMKCSRPTEDYGPRVRCPHCRLLLLICSNCANDSNPPLCELCQHSRVAPTVEAAPGQPLRILCLHGFRQTGRKLQGRTGALRKKLGPLVELVYIDAPHELPFWYKDDGGDGLTSNPSGKEGNNATCSTLPTTFGQPKRAWLLTLETMQAAAQLREEGQRWQAAPPSCTSQQHLGETEGWTESWRCLKEAIRSMGPFDGVMGFSQGAAVAAYLASLQHLVQHRGQVLEEETVSIPCWQEVIEVFQKPQFSFAWICSGYSLKLQQDIAPIMQRVGAVSLSSLHVYGGAGLDEQISSSESAFLEAFFSSQQRRTVTHPGGHVIPCSKPFIKQYRAFLAQQCHEGAAGPITEL